MDNSLKNQIKAYKYRGYRQDLAAKLCLSETNIDFKLRNGDITVVKALAELVLARKENEKRDREIILEITNSIEKYKARNANSDFINEKIKDLKVNHDNE